MSGHRNAAYEPRPEWVRGDGQGLLKLLGRLPGCLADPGWVAQVSRHRLRVANRGWLQLGGLGLGPVLWVPHHPAGLPGHDLVMIKDAQVRGHAQMCHSLVSRPLTPHWPQQVTWLSPKSTPLCRGYRQKEGRRLGATSATCHAGRRGGLELCGGLAREPV